MKHEIKLYGPIDAWWNSAEEIIGGIPKNATEIEMRIHSPGGSVGEGLAIYHALRDHSARVTTIVDGYAASTASFLMLAGDARQVHRNSLVFVHNPWTYAEGDANELRKTAEGLDVHADAIRDIYMQRTGMSEDDITEMMEDTAFFRGVDAKDNGFATEIIDDEGAENRIAAMLDMSAFAAQAEEQGVMSKQLTRKEVEAKLAEVTAAHETITAEFAALQESAPLALEAKNTEHEAAILAKDEEVAAARAEVEASATQVTEITAKIREITESRDALTVELADTKAAAATQGAELAKAQTALKNPAVADALMTDAQAQAQAKVDAEADEAEKIAAAAAATEEPKNIREQYERMPFGADRAKFLEDNKRAILACEPTA